MIYSLISVALAFIIGFIVGGVRGVRIGYYTAAQDTMVDFYVKLNQAGSLTNEEKAKVGYALMEADLKAIKTRQDENAQ